MQTRHFKSLPYRVLDALDPGRPQFDCISATVEASVAGIVFSKDRPMQLDALLRSYRLMARNPAELHVIYSTSTPDYSSAYRDLAAWHTGQGVRFSQETDLGGFAVGLARLLHEVPTRTVFFLVDDILFIRPLDMAAFASLATPSIIPSLRLGRNIVRSFTRGVRQMRPHFKRITAGLPAMAEGLNPFSEDLWAWRWRSGVIDWNYPYSVDGNIFVTDEIRDLVAHTVYEAPNSLEAALHALFREEREFWGICYGHSRIVNSPINRVQNEVANLHGRHHQDDLLGQWIQGLRWDISGLENVSNSSVHEEIRLPTSLPEER